jgi:formylglycine-generating enzyme required for sulfatase activity
MMVQIPAGEFIMGSDHGDSDERPIHTVYLDAFYIDKYEVANAQYRKFIEATGRPEPKLWSDAAHNQPNQPVVGVTWYDAMAYAAWAGKRLPTEAEWEKAARGGLVGKKYPWGDEPPDAGGQYRANFDLEAANILKGYSGTLPVGSLSSNGYGLYDMAGNVWEWCLDEYREDFYASSPRDNPLAGDPMSALQADYHTIKTKRVLRGGAWDAYDNLIRVSNRNQDYPDSFPYNVGFRCVSVRLR